MLAAEMIKPLNILILEDNPQDLGLIKRELKRLGRELEIRSTDNKSNYIDLLNERVPDILLSDFLLPDINGSEALDILKKINSATPFILISGAVGEEKATEMILKGASNFILKDNLSRLIPAIEKEIKNLNKPHEIKKTEFTQKQNEIIKISMNIISNDSIHNLTIKNITTKMGISEPALYKHFKNKSDILSAILEKYELFFNIADGNGHSPLTRIMNYIIDRYDQLDKEPDMAKIILSDTLFPTDNDLQIKKDAILEEFENEFHFIIESGLKCGDFNNKLRPKSIYRIIFGSTRLLINQWCSSNYSFDLNVEGLKHWKEIESLIKA